MFFFPIPLWPWSLARSGGGPWPFWTTTMTFGRSFDGIGKLGQLSPEASYGTMVKFPPV